MSHAGIVPIAKIDRAVRAGRHITRRKPRVIADGQLAAVGRFHGGGPGFDAIPKELMAKRIGEEIFVAILFRESVSLIDDAADGDVAPLEIRMRGVIEITVSERIMQRAMLAERFPVIRPGDGVQ